MALRQKLLCWGSLSPWCCHVVLLKTCTRQGTTDWISFSHLHAQLSNVYKSPTNFTVSRQRTRYSKLLKHHRKKQSDPININSFIIFMFFNVADCLSYWIVFRFRIFIYKIAFCTDCSLACDPGSDWPVERHGSV